MLKTNAVLYGDDIAINYVSDDDIESKVTWIEFENYANRTANALIANGIKRGDKVSVLMNNSTHMK